MTVASVLSLLIAVIKAIPTLGKWADELVALYVASRVAEMRDENRAGIKKAIYEQDQRDLEEAIGSSRAGEASGLPGSVIVDSLPGVDGMHKPKGD